MLWLDKIGNGAPLRRPLVQIWHVGSNRPANSGAILPSNSGIGRDAATAPLHFPRPDQTGVAWAT